MLFPLLECVLLHRVVGVGTVVPNVLNLVAKFPSDSASPMAPPVVLFLQGSSEIAVVPLPPTVVSLVLATLMWVT